MLILFFKKSQISQDIEFFARLSWDIVYSSFIGGGFEQAQTRLAHQLLKDPARPKPIQHYLENENLKMKNFFIVNLRSVYFDDAIEKVTITSPRFIKELKMRFLKSDAKSLGLHFSQGGWGIAKKESSNLLKDTVITSLSNLTKKAQLII